MARLISVGAVLLIAGLGLAGCGADTPAGRLEQSTQRADAASAAAWESCEALNAAALQQDPGGTMDRAPVNCGPRPAGAARP